MTLNLAYKDNSWVVKQNKFNYRKVIFAIIVYIWLSHELILLPHRFFDNNKLNLKIKVSLCSNLKKCLAWP